MKSQETNKIALIFDQISNGQIQAALQKINKLLSKKKNFDKLTNEELYCLQLYKGICNSKLQQFGEAYDVFTKLQTEMAKTKTDYTMFKQISLLANQLDKNEELESIFTQFVNSSTQKDLTLIEDYLLYLIQIQKYELAKNTALKLFKTTQNQKFMFINIFSQYYFLKQQFSSSTITKENYDKNLSLILMFLSKQIKDIGLNSAVYQQCSDNTEQKTLYQQIILFNCKILTKLSKFAQLLEFKSQFPELFKTNISYFKWYEIMYKESRIPENKLLYLNELIWHLRNNSTLSEEYTLDYNLYVKFINFLFSEVEILFIEIEESNLNEFLMINLENKQLKQEEIFIAIEKNEASIILLSNFFSMLENQKQIFIANYTANPHFLSALKINLNAQMLILTKLASFNKSRSLTSPNNSQKLTTAFINNLQLYCKYYSSTYTFFEEIMLYIETNSISFLKELINELEQLYNSSTKLISKTIIHINLLKFQIYTGDFKLTSYEEFQLISEKLLEYYCNALTQIYQDAFVAEKGERSYADEYILLLSDLSYNWLFGKQELKCEEQKCFLVLIQILQTALQLSPFNYDIRFKLLQIYEIIGCPDQMVAILKEMDIKSIQFDTLGLLVLLTNYLQGYLYFKVYSENEIQNIQEEILHLSLQFYSENFIQCNQTVQASLKHQTYNIIPQYQKYSKWIDFSYQKMLVFYKKLESTFSFGKKDLSFELNFEYLQTFIQNLLTQKSQITFNIDTTIIQPCIKFNSGNVREYWNYLGIYNNIEVFEIEFMRLLLNYNLENFARTKEFKSQQLDDTLNQLNLFVNSFKMGNQIDFSKFRLYKKVKRSKFSMDELSKKMLEEEMKNEIDDIKFELQLFEFVRNLNSTKKISSEGMEAVLKSIENIKTEAIKRLQLIKNWSNTDSLFFMSSLKHLNRYFLKTQKFIQSFISCQESMKQVVARISKEEKGALKKKINNLNKSITELCNSLVNINLEATFALQDYLNEMAVKFNENLSSWFGEVDKDFSKILMPLSKCPLLNFENSKKISTNLFFNDIKQQFSLYNANCEEAKKKFKQVLSQ